MKNTIFGISKEIVRCHLTSDKSSGYTVGVDYIHLHPTEPAPISVLFSGWLHNKRWKESKVLMELEEKPISGIKGIGEQLDQ